MAGTPATIQPGTARQSDKVLASRPTVGATAATTKHFIGVPDDYQALVRNKAQFDALGRRILEDSQTVKDPSKEVLRKDAALDTAAKHPKGVLAGAADQLFKGRWIHEVDANGRARDRWVSDGGYSSTDPTGRGSGLVSSGGGNGFGGGNDGASGDLDTADVIDPVAPRYYEGDELSWAGRNPEEIAAQQRKMIDAGVLPKNFKRFGFWDATSIAAYKSVLGYANQAGVDDNEIMNRWKTYGLDKADVPATQLVVKSPEEIKQVLQTTAGRIIGRSLTDGEANTLVAGYQNIDRTAQEAKAAADALQAGGEESSYQQPMDTETFAINEIKARMKPEADWVTAQGRMKEFYSILGEGGGMGGYS